MKKKNNEEFPHRNTISESERRRFNILFYDYKWSEVEKYNLYLNTRFDHQFI
jgi:hypothetical protein